MNNLSALKQKYIKHIQSLHYTKKTIADYNSYLTQFITFLKGRGIEEIAVVTKEEIMEYQIHLYEEINRQGSQNGVNHQNKKLCVTKSFTGFLHETNYIPYDPGRNVPYAKAPKTLPRTILTKAEIKKILQAPDTGTLSGYRARTMFEVLYSTGIRRSELNNLCVRDVDYTEGYIRINNGKGKTDRVVPVGKIACRYLENYIKAIRPDLAKGKAGEYLFISYQGQKLSINILARELSKYAQKAKIKKRVTPHVFRHTCATLMLKNKANIRHIQELLGHRSLNSTQVYTHLTIMDLKQVHKKCHPREIDAR